MAKSTSKPSLPLRRRFQAPFLGEPRRVAAAPIIARGATLVAVAPGQRLVDCRDLFPALLRTGGAGLGKALRPAQLPIERSGGDIRLTADRGASRAAR